MKRKVILWFSNWFCGRQLGGVLLWKAVIGDFFPLHIYSVLQHYLQRLLLFPNTAGIPQSQSSLPCYPNVSSVFFLSFLTSSSSHTYSRRLFLLWKICLSSSNTKPTLFQIMRKGTISGCESGTQSPTLPCWFFPGTVRFGIITYSQKYLLACISWSPLQQLRTLNM